jgi:hypothetical protein
MFFEAIESRVFDIYGPLETLSTLRTNYNIERCNATTWLVNFSNSEEYSRFPSSDTRTMHGLIE